MPIQEFRETISQDATLPIGVGAPLVIQRKINLHPYKRHVINFLDFFDDSIIWKPVGYAYEFVVSIYPISLVDMGIEFGTFTPSAPDAGDDNIMFKCHGVGTIAGFITERFPNQFLGSSPTFDFYSPHLYMTLIIHALETDVSIQPRVSIYMAIDEQECNDTEFGMGVYTEYLYAQTKERLAVGTQVAPNVSTFMGNHFPMWRAGGIRPERMMRGGDVLASFFLPGFAQDSEDMVNRTELRNFYNDSKEMQSFDDAFGSTTAKGGVPDWIRIGELGDIAIPERPEYPPKVTQNNPAAAGLGNTIMV